MIRVSRLLALPGDPLVFDAAGAVVDVIAPPGPAYLVLEPVTDALKHVSDGLVTGSVDRDTVARVVAFAVDRAVLARFSDAVLTPEQLIESVTGAGVVWTAVPAAG